MDSYNAEETGCAVTGSIVLLDGNRAGSSSGEQWKKH